MKRRIFMQRAGLLAASSFLSSPRLALASPPAFPVVRPGASQRRFRSRAVEAAIAEFAARVPDPELAWLFGNCLPHALDSTVTYTERAGRPDTYVRLGDPDAMGLRDSALQVWPYLAFVTQDAALRQLVAGVINRQTRCILQDPYANSFYQDITQVGAGQADRTATTPGVHERKWEIDSLCHPIRLAYHYWKTTGDEQPFDAQWQQAVQLIAHTFRAQQRKAGPGPYHFQRQTLSAADTQPLAGYGYPTKPVGLIASAFRPSGDATLLPFLVPSNFFAVASLRQAALMLNDIAHDAAAYADFMALADEVALALSQHATVEHPTHGRVYAYEVDGYGGHALLDEAHLPSLLALPYLGAVPRNDPVYQHTRQLALSAANPFFYHGRAAAGIGSPRTGADLIWPLSLIARGLTSQDDAELRTCVRALRASHAGRGYLPEAFAKDDPSRCTRASFAAANALFGELLWKVYQERPQVLGG